MVTERGLLDTSAVIALDEHIDDPRLPGRVFISAITLAELSVGPLVADSETERADRLGLLQHAEANIDALAFDASAARAFGRVSADLRLAGRKSSSRALDALIAAKQKLLTLLAEKRRALITHAVTRGLDPNVQLRDSGIEWLGQI